MMRGEVVRNDVRRHYEQEGKENDERGADGMRKKRLKNFAVTVGKHFKGWRAQKVKYCENRQAGRDAEQKTLDGMVSERAEVESTEEIAGVGTDAAGNEGGKAEI